MKIKNIWNHQLPIDSNPAFRAPLTVQELLSTLLWQSMLKGVAPHEVRPVSTITVGKTHVWHKSTHNKKKHRNNHGVRWTYNRHSMFQHAVDMNVVSMFTYNWMTFSELSKNLPWSFLSFLSHLKEGFAAHFAVEEVFPEANRPCSERQAHTTNGVWIWVKKPPGHNQWYCWWKKSRHTSGGW